MKKQMTSAKNLQLILVQYDDKSVLAVEQNGTFASSGLSHLHNEREHKGIDNKLMLSRVYTTSFTCKYNMEHYPFDMQICTMMFVPQV